MFTCKRVGTKKGWVSEQTNTMMLRHMLQHTASQYDVLHHIIIKNANRGVVPAALIGGGRRWAEVNTSQHLSTGSCALVYPPPSV